ncbi:UNVERIFIED_ORG: nicotinamidase-related amidase [Arthrobacter globiformis]|nr:nicotinamidase-related amidase [Arthrobacter globiformis]
MTTLPDRPNTALVVLDVQKGVVAEAHQRDAVVSNIALLVDRAREAGVPVVWVRIPMTGWRRAARPGNMCPSWGDASRNRW